MPSPRSKWYGASAKRSAQTTGAGAGDAEQPEDEEGGGRREREREQEEDVDGRGRASEDEQQPEQIEVQPVGSDGEVLELLAERRAETRVLEVPAVVLHRLGEHQVVLRLLPVRERDAEVAPPDLQRETGEHEGGDGGQHADEDVAASAVLDAGEGAHRAPQRSGVTGPL